MYQTERKRSRAPYTLMLVSVKKPNEAKNFEKIMCKKSVETEHFAEELQNS